LLYNSLCLCIGNSWYSQLEDYLCRIPHAGVGECGIDKNVLKKQQLSESYTGVPVVTMEDQIDILKRHIDLAVKYQRVLTLHCVSGCWGQLLQIFQSLEGETEGQGKWKRKRKDSLTESVEGNDR
jgi:Tat protein secretion system quality control protein TatD with DNase activity